MTNVTTVAHNISQGNAQPSASSVQTVESSSTSNEYAEVWLEMQMRCKTGRYTKKSSL